MLTYTDLSEAIMFDVIDALFTAFGG